MNPAEFQDKWRRAELTERSAAQQHFLDLCELLDHPKPADVDPKGELFTFEKGAAKRGGSDGWADVWKRGYFAFEYKGRHKDLDAAYRQLDEYRAALENPPLLVTCDMDRIVVHTNFTATRQEVHEIPLDALGEPRNLEILRAVFHAPHKLKPGTTSEAITTEAARRTAEIAVALRERGLDPLQVARFLDRVVFSLFAEDIGLLPEGLFTKVLDKSRRDPPLFRRFAEQLFTAMAEGGYVGLEEIRHFDGHLFEGTTVLELTAEEIEGLYRVALLDWSAIDPSILGTLFERGLDPGKRSQLGAHYTSREDIETLVEPVVMKPLRREWREVQELVSNLLTTGKKHPKEADRAKPPPTGRRLKKARDEAQMLLRRFHQGLAHVRVLDPACGSGNFLYVTLQKLKDLEKEVAVFTLDNGLNAEVPLVGPWQLHGIEINPYAFELAQMTVWIGYLQWTRQHGTGTWGDPILRPMDTFECKDAILDLSDPDHPREPDWPRVDFIVGNPPFLGNRRARGELGDEYVDALSKVYEEDLGGKPDLCCYWFWRASKSISAGRARRAGLLGTQAIRKGTSQKTLRAIAKQLDIFFAEADRPWILDGAAVRISMVGFGQQVEESPTLDGREVQEVNSDLTAGTDLGLAKKLPQNAGLAFQGTIKSGGFDIEDALALEFLQSPNPSGRPNSDVVRPWLIGRDIQARPQHKWILDFGVGMSLEVASRYEAPFEHLKAVVRPQREKTNYAKPDDYPFWQLWNPRPEMRSALTGKATYTATSRVAKHRILVSIGTEHLPDARLVVFASDNPWMLGVLQSRPHLIWALALASRHGIGNDPTYNLTTCFETFPFPEPTEDQKRAIAQAARELDQLRERWLNPPEWVNEEVLEFPGATDGPWTRYIHDPDDQGIGTVRYPRQVPKDQAHADKLAQRTLTNLYNQRPTWLHHAHQTLDEAVATAYNWPTNLPDDSLLERILSLNVERAGTR